MSDGGQQASKARVLVVDDEPAHRQLVAAALAHCQDLELAGEAFHGKRGVEQAAELQPDVIVLDLRMPVMDGLTALPLIRRAAPLARVLVWSGNGELDMERAREAGAWGWLGKVSPVEHLVALLRAAAQHSPWDQAIEATLLADGS
ncbi:MAG: two component transcriptional regulator, LuxR family [Thermoleophilia bacterium]|nr:two component transcriptional regulator, LuxR family [Thermoleophilia bacterium]